ncbi:hypothetical protein [Mesorhizobium sp. LjNodule214]|uniref:hypothetical protein n=1 Tax=Mesorhizobium sp. LjNodule214 TaxID=3342252 RepID=UPI003ED02415
MSSDGGVRVHVAGQPQKSLAKSNISGEVAFSLSSAAIDAAINGKGFVLAQLSMAADDIAAGRLIVPFDQRIRLSDAYFLAWDRAALEKPFAPELRAWIVSISKRLDASPADWDR